MAFCIVLLLALSVYLTKSQDLGAQLDTIDEQVRQLTSQLTQVTATLDDVAKSSQLADRSANLLSQTLDRSSGLRNFD